MPTPRSIRIIYFLVAIAFHLALLFTDVGNYFHGGTVIELVILQVVAVLIVTTAIKLLGKSQAIENIFIVLCAVVPIITVVWSLISAFPSKLI